MSRVLGMSDNDVLTIKGMKKGHSQSIIKTIQKNASSSNHQVDSKVGYHFNLYEVARHTKTWSHMFTNTCHGFPLS